MPNRVKKIQYMKGKVLISEPFLADPNFSRSVILITEHNATGSFGFVLNQKTNILANTMVEELHLVTQAVYNGGPVDLQSFHCLHTYDHIQDAVHVCENVYWGGNFEQVFQELKQGLMDPKNIKFFIGYSGWGPHQLDDELTENAWHVGNLESQDIFDSSIDDQDLWKLAIRNLGGQVSLLANSPVDPNLN
jgi:putative transcriptional regulator